MASRKGLKSRLVPNRSVLSLSVLSLLILLVNSSAWSEEVRWPLNQWQEQIASAEETKALDEYLFPGNKSEPPFAGIQTDGVVIIKQGEIVYERYRPPYDKNKPHIAWSVTKSFLNAITGIALRDAYVTLDTPVKELMPMSYEWQGQPLTIKHLLHMSSGLDWQETYETSPFKSSVLEMLYTLGRKDMGAFVAKYKPRSEPGSDWYYSSGDSILLSAALAQAIGNQYAFYPWKRLFEPLGMESVTWETDSHSVFIASSYLYATPRDFARFGYLYLRNGEWNGEQILPLDWVSFSTRLAPAYQKEDNTGGGNYAAHWWINRSDSKKGIPKAWAELPDDLFFAGGHWGQSIVVIPSLDLVLVRNANDRNKGIFELEHYISLVIDTFGEKE